MFHNVPHNMALRFNCLPIALARLQGDVAALIQAQTTAKSTEHVATTLRRGRRYKDWSRVHGLQLVPQRGLQLKDKRQLLIHFESADGPHCRRIEIKLGLAHR